ncbi:MAG: response regulator, partial [Spirochaetaceae bacterium]|nr:response regulator [Spirochaetaceae bacterium]
NYGGYMSNIYIVDDDKDIIDAVSMILETEGHEIAFQTDPINVVENIQNFHADLVVLDVIFPEEDDAGFKIARLLKHDQKTHDIPLLMLSAVNEKGHYAGTFSNKDRDEVFLPVDQFMEKPIAPKKLLSVVKEMLN